jgi:mono/diheme cytochrome c family protein
MTFIIPERCNFFNTIGIARAVTRSVPSSRARLIVKTALLTLLGAAAMGAAAGFVVYRAGWYDIGASASHLQPVYSLLEQGMRHSVQRHARAIAVPRLDQPQQALRGAALYRSYCVQCHGGPGFAPQPHGMSMQPAPGPLVDAAGRWRARELYWITRHGIKMSGMPAWEARLDEAETWAVVAFIQRLPGLDAAAFKEMTAAPLVQQPAPATAPRGDVQRGQRILAQYACHSCHLVPGVTGSEVYVGRPLDGLAKRRVIAGALENTQDNLVRWIRNPQAIDPQAAMPNMGVSERDALDISAYLLSK